MSLETILNLTWLLLSVFLVLVLGIPDWQRRGAAGNRLPQRVGTLFLAAIFVFPCISASDDLWSFRCLPKSQKTLQSRATEENQRGAWRLALLFESLQTFTLAKPFAFSAGFCFLGLAPSSSEPARRWSLLRRAGRSPPALYA